MLVIHTLLETTTAMLGLRRVSIATGLFAFAAAVLFAGSIVVVALSLTITTPKAPDGANCPDTSMPMDLGFIMHEFWVYGFFGAVITLSLWPALAIPMFIWFVAVWTAIHREDPEPIRVEFHTWPIAALAFGASLGTYMAGRLEWPRLFDFRAIVGDGLGLHRDRKKRDNERKSNPESMLYLWFALVATFAVYYLTAAYSDACGQVAISDARLYGGILLGIGLVGLICTSVWSLFSGRHQFLKRQNTLWMIILSWYTSLLPSIWDYPAVAGWSIAVRLVLFLVLGTIILVLGILAGLYIRCSATAIRVFSDPFKGKHATELDENARFPNARYALTHGIILALAYITVIWPANLVNMFGAVKSGWPPVVIIAGMSVLWVCATEFMYWMKRPVVFFKRKTANDTQELQQQMSGGGIGGDMLRTGPKLSLRKKGAKNL